MLTENAASIPADAGSASAGAASPVCYLGNRFVPLADAQIPLMTHPILYGTAVFEGIRAYWNADQGQLYALRTREHFERLSNSCKVMLMEPPGTVDEMVAILVDLMRRNGFREDAYIRPSVFKSSQGIGVRLHNLEQSWYILAIPFGDYIDTTNGISAMTSSWRRTSDQTIPARAKITGSYVNCAFTKTEAMLNGADEAIVLMPDGHVSEGSAENLFMVRNGALVTPGVADDILEGVTRAGIIELAKKELGIQVVERSIDRTELYVCDEVFLCGTGAQVSPVTTIDHRPVGKGGIGPVTAKIKDLYFDAVRGRLPAYAHWLTPIY